MAGLDDCSMQNMRRPVKIICMLMSGLKLLKHIASNSIMP